MNEFDKRAKAFEAKFEEWTRSWNSRSTSRMARLFGLWAAEQMGLQGKEAEAYADEAVSIEVAKTGRVDLIAVHRPILSPRVWISAVTALSGRWKHVI